MRSALYDLLERTAWTFVQAFIGSLVATNVAAGAVNWREVLISAAVAGAVAVMKVVGVNAASVAQTVSAVASETPAELAKAPAVAAVVAQVEKSPAVAKAVEVVSDVTAVKAAENTPVAKLAETVAATPAVQEVLKDVQANPTVETTEQVARALAQRLIAGK